MQSSNSQLIARVGGAVLAVSVILPWFVLDIQQLNVGEGFSMWKFERNAAIICVVVGLLCMIQPQLGSPELSAMAYLAIGGVVAGAIIYKVFVSPPGSEYMEALSVEGVSLEQLLESIGIEFKPAYGSYLGLAGALAIAFAALIQVRAPSGKNLGLSVEEQAAFDRLRPKTSAKPVELAPGQQRYVAPAPPQFAMQPPPQQQYGAPVPPPQ